MDDRYHDAHAPIPPTYRELPPAKPGEIVRNGDLMLTGAIAVANEQIARLTRALAGTTGGGGMTNIKWAVRYKCGLIGFVGYSRQNVRDSAGLSMRRGDRIVRVRVVEIKTKRSRK